MSESQEPLFGRPPESGRPGRGVRASVSFSVGLMLLAFLLVSSATHRNPGPRLARKDRLVGLIRSQDARTSALRKELDDLKRQLAAIEKRAGKNQKTIDALRRQADALAPYAGLAAISGRGMVVVLKDSTLRRSPTGDPNDLVIHEQDLQAVVNALWQGGAEGIAVNGERITALSAIRCVGNTLLLHGSVYSPPYRVSAIGSPRAMNDALDGDPGVQRLQLVAEKFKLGYAATKDSHLVLPPFRGVLDLATARQLA